MKVLLTILSSVLCIFLNAQQTTAVEFAPCFHGEKLVIGKTYFEPTHRDSITITALRFYISDPVQPGVAHLMELDEEKRNLQFTRKIDIQGDKSKTYYIGIDSTTNVSGAFGGDLDPTTGMYWTWNTGYINVKIEGISKNCSALKHEFQFHLGGYAGKQNALCPLSLSSSSKKQEIEIRLDDFFAQINLATTPNIMSPGAEAVRLSRLFASTFHQKH